MSSLDDFYTEKYNREYEQKEKRYNQIIQEFEDMSLEEKVNELIEIYAREVVYG